MKSLSPLETGTTPSTRQLRLVQVFTVIAIALAFALTFFLLFDPERREQVINWLNSPFGLFVLFVLSIISNATLVLPVPSLALTAVAATVANPLVVGLVAGAGQTLGEMTGYLAGYSGQELIDESPRYARMTQWMRRYGPITIFVAAIIPNPVFDIAGIIAGALRMPLVLYLASAGAGKIIKNIAVAYGAALGVEWLLQLFAG